MFDPQWLVTTSVTSLVALGGLYVNLSNNHRESKKYRSESNEFLRNISNSITNISKDIEELKVKDNGGKRIVIAYLSIGEAEDYRYYWKKKWNKKKPKWIIKENENWEGNYIVKYWSPEWKNIIKKVNVSIIAMMLCISIFPTSIMLVTFIILYLDIKIDSKNFFVLESIVLNFLKLSHTFIVRYTKSFWCRCFLRKYDKCNNCCYEWEHIPE